MARGINGGERWCPKGCGKQIKSRRTHPMIQDRYICFKCRTTFTKAELIGDEK